MMAENGSKTQQKGEITCWMLDTRTLWPGIHITDSGTEALSLISAPEREICTRKYHLMDAKMSLASALLKRLFVHKTLGIPWNDITYSRKKDAKHGKPCALLPDGSLAPVEFNVSHQAGLVVLVGCRTDSPKDNTTDETGRSSSNTSEEAHKAIDLGVDIVCVNERNDARIIDAEGFDSYIDMYAEIFSPEELFSMKYTTDPFPLLDGTIVTPDMLGRHDRCVRRDQILTATLPNGEKRTFSSELLIDAKLRRFYTYWCFKEAYIKLDGEALLAKWIAELEFRHVRAPRAGVVARCSTHGTWGERVGDVEVFLKHRRLEDVRMEIQAFEENYMIGVAASPRERLPEVLTGFETLGLEGIMEVARGAVG